MKTEEESKFDNSSAFAAKKLGRKMAPRPIVKEQKREQIKENDISRKIEEYMLKNEETKEEDGIKQPTI